MADMGTDTEAFEAVESTTADNDEKTKKKTDKSNPAVPKGTGEEKKEVDDSLNSADHLSPDPPSSSTSSSLDPKMTDPTKLSSTTSSNPPPSVPPSSSVVPAAHPSVVSASGGGGGGGGAAAGGGGGDGAHPSVVSASGAGGQAGRRRSGSFSGSSDPNSKGNPVGGRHRVSSVSGSHALLPQPRPAAGGGGAGAAALAGGGGAAAGGGGGGGAGAPASNDEYNLSLTFDFAHPVQQGDKSDGLDKAADFIDKTDIAVGHVDSLLGLGETLGNTIVKGEDELTAPTEPGKSATQAEIDDYNTKKEKYESDKKDADNMEATTGWTNAIMGGVNAVSGIWSMARHGRRAAKAQGKNHIVHRQSMWKAIGSACKTVAGGMRLGSGISTLQKRAAEKDDDKKQYSSNGGIMSVIGSVASLAGSAINSAADGFAAGRYGRIVGLNNKDGRQKINRPPQNQPETQSAAAARKKNNTLFKAFDMAEMNAKVKHKQNKRSAIASGFSAFGSLLGGVGSVLGVAGVDPSTTRLVGGILGTIGGVIGEGAAIGSNVADHKANKESKQKREQYVDNYLNDASKLQRIKAKAQAGDHGGAGVTINDDDAKRILLKRLGIYSGNVKLGNVPVNLSPNDKKEVYNHIAMKRAQKLNALPQAERDANLKKIGLHPGAQVQDIADALGYEA